MKAIRKIGDLLRCFSAAEPEHSLSDLARRLGHSTSGTYDLVEGLAEIGLLRKIDRGRYRLGPLVATLYRTLEDSSALLRAAQPVMAKIVADHNETLHLTQHDHGGLLVVEALEGARPLRVARTVIGPHLGLHACPPGLLHLGALSQAQLAEWLDRNAAPGGPVASRAQFQQDLADLAAEGFAIGPVGDHHDLTCLAAQLRDHAGHPVAVLSMTVPCSRHDRQPRAFRNVMAEAARRISAQLGYEQAVS